MPETNPAPASSHVSPDPDAYPVEWFHIDRHPQSSTLPGTGGKLARGCGRDPKVEALLNLHSRRAQPREPKNSIADRVSTDDGSRTLGFGFLLLILAMFTYPQGRCQTRILPSRFLTSVTLTPVPWHHTIFSAVRDVRGAGID